jgi:hypothetical protein
MTPAKPHHPRHKCYAEDATVENFIHIPRHEEKSEGTMLNKVAKMSFAVLMPIVTFATPKVKETIELQVVSSKTQVHGSFPAVFTYTDLMFTLVNGKKVIYACAQRGDACPLMESGKAYSADRVGDVTYVSMTSPEGKRPISVKYMQLGSW